MELTLKENMILNKVIGDYVIDNNLFFDECKTLNKIVNVLKEEKYNIAFEKGARISKIGDYIYNIKDFLLKEAKEEALKELCLYDIKSTCNKKWFGEHKNV